eukprot:CAMPEP_0114555062 /NCGR_PEP_ID=MMETSP0114-20121206/8547_1 /TAXON_ID=31324 /ORGANISM="Goniomonas sp, Strain m" /LENGTH=186 /DNA_ID=CAMNT_0001740159 /DNA_START=42 /DNA_END=602 /DNA_ORIENTATION=+
MAEKSSQGPFPKVVVFDLDFTIWYPEMDCLSGPPFSKDKKGRVFDRAGEEVHIFDGAKRTLLEIAQDARFKEIQVGWASRTTEVSSAQKCLQLLDVSSDNGAFSASLQKLGQYSEIYPGDKKRHFRAMAKASGVPLEDFLFFDNERRNTQSVSELGVTCVCTPEGMTYKAWLRGLEKFAEDKNARR